MTNKKQNAKDKAEEEKQQKDALASAKYDLGREHLMDQDELQQALGAEIQEKIGGQVPGFQYILPITPETENRPHVITEKVREALTEGYTKLNTLTPGHVKPEWLKFLEELTGFFSLLLWVGSILCFIAYGLRRDVDNLYLGIVLAAVVLVTGIFSYSQNAKSASLMAQFAKLLANQVAVRTDKRKPLKSDFESANPPKTWDDNLPNDPGVWQFDSKYLVRGDVVTLKSGNKVPADIRILKASNLKVDNSPLTGESIPLERTKNNVEPDSKEATNIIFFGTDIKEGTCTGVVLRTGDDTFMGQIAQLTERTATEQTPINKEIHHFIGIVSAVAIFLGVSFFIIGAVLGTTFIDNIVFMIGIIVANVPEGLLATVTVVLTLTSQKMHSKNVLVKNMEGVETLGSTTCICSDKTGTLTQNRMTFSELLFDKTIFRTEFVEAGRDGPQYQEVDAARDTFRLFHRAMCLNTTATFQSTEYDGVHSAPRPFYLKKSGGIPAVQWDTEGDASESSIIKYAQYMYPGVYKPNMPTEEAEIVELFQDDYVSRSRLQGFPGDAAGGDGNAAAAAAGADDNSGAGFEEAGKIPFNSRNKYHVHITYNRGNAEHPYTVWIKGAPERIMGRCDRHIESGVVRPLEEHDRTEITQLQEELMAKGRRVLAFAKYDLTADEVPPAQVGEDGEMPRHPFEGDAKNFPMGETVDDAERTKIRQRFEKAGKMNLWQGYEQNAHKKLVFIGMAALIDPPRPAVPDAVLSCQRAGIRVVMVTGDHPETAAAIARMVNIITTDKVKRVGPTKDVVHDEDGEIRRSVDGSLMTQPVQDPCLFNRHGESVADSRAIVVPGWEISPETSDEKWRFIFSHDEVVFARTSPAQKLQIVQRFQLMENDIVAVTGDGVNDAPALKKADIGIAMGIAGTEVSKTAADMILIDDNFASIVKGVEEGRLIFDNLKKSIAYTLSSNIPEIAPFLVFITVQTPLPLSTVLILCIDLGTDMVPAISMAWENAESDIMSRPARDSAVDRLVTKKLVTFAYLQIGMIQAAAGFFTWIVVLNDYGYPPHVLPGLGSSANWGQQVLYCKVDGGVFRNVDGEIYNGQDQASALAAEYFFWDPADTGSVDECQFPARIFEGAQGSNGGFDAFDPTTYGNFTADEKVFSAESIQALKEVGFIEFYPWRARESVFFRTEWLSYDYAGGKDAEVPGAGDADEVILFSNQLPGVWVVDPESVSSDEAEGRNSVLDTTYNYLTGSLGYSVPNSGECPTFKTGRFLQPTSPGESVELGYIKMDDEGVLRMNVASRMLQKEALHHAQCAYFVSIVVVQWADLMICKTRWLSIYHQGMKNPAMNFGLVFETILASFLCYVPGVGDGLGTRPLRLLHWMPAVPFSIVIVLYDEVRKYIMRHTSRKTTQGLQVIMDYGWLARNTYY